MTHREEEAQPTASHGQWSGEFETDPLDSLQEEHASNVVHDDLVLASAMPSGATAPYEGLLADLPDQDEPALTLPTPQTITGKLSRVTVRNFYDDPAPLGVEATPEEEAEHGGFALTRERVEEYSLPVPGVALPQDPARHRRSSFELHDEKPPAFPSDESDDAEEESLSDEWSLPDSTPQVDLAWDLPSGQVVTADDAGLDTDYLPNFRSMQVESAFAFADAEDDVKVTWELPAEIQAIVGEETSKGTSLDSIREMIREELADLKALATPEPKRSPAEPYSDEELDRIIRAIPKTVPEKWGATVTPPTTPPPVPGAWAMATPLQPPTPPATPPTAQPMPSWAGRPKPTPELRLRGDRGPRTPVKVPWVKLSIIALLFYFLPWADALSISLFFAAVWGAWAIGTGTLHWLRELRGIPHLKLHRRR